METGKHKPARRGDVGVAGGWSPGVEQSALKLWWKCLEHAFVYSGLEATRRSVDLGWAEGGNVVGEPVGQVGHQGVAVDRHAVDAVPGGAQSLEQLDHRGRRVQPDGVSDSAALGRIGRQNDGDAPGRRWRRGRKSVR